MDVGLAYSAWLAQLKPDSDRVLTQFADGSQVEFDLYSHETRVVTDASAATDLQPILPDEPNID